MDKECQDLLAHISLLLGIGGNNIKDAEQYLNSHAVSAPAALIVNMAKLVEHSPDFGIKKVCIVLMRRYFKEANKGIWTKISKPDQAVIRAELLRVFSLQSDIKILRQFCFTINELLGTMDEEEEEWPELEALVQSTLQHASDSAVEIGLRLLDALATYKAKKLMLQKETLKQIIASAFSKTLEIKIRSCIVLCSLLSVINSKDAKMFQCFLPNIAITMHECVIAKREEDIKELLESLTDVAEAEPTYFKADFPNLYKSLIEYSKKSTGLEETTRHMMIEFILSIIERITSLAKIDLLEDLCTNVFEIMAEIDKNIDDDWCKPKEGFNNEIENEEEENIKFGMMTFDRLCSCIGEKDMLQVYNVLLNVTAKNPDWRYKHAFLMSISQVGEYIEEIEKIKPLVPVLISSLQNECPKVRYASLHAIGQLADDMHPHFTTTFQEELLPPLIALIDDKVPRVSAHSCAALTNVLEYLPKEDAHTVAPKLLPKLLDVINNGISVQKENAMTSMSSLAEACDKLFIEFYDQIMPFLFKCLKEVKAKEYRQLRGQSIECITIIGLAVGKEKFMPNAMDVIQELLNIQNQKLTDDDPQRNYLLSAWQRMCMILEKDFGTFLDTVMDPILSLAEKAVMMGISNLEIKERDLQDVLKEVADQKTDDISTAELESKEIAIEMISVFASELKGSFTKFIPRTLDIVAPLLTYSAKSGIRKSAAKVMSDIYKCALESGAQASDLAILAKNLISKLWDVVLKEANINAMCTQLVSIKKIIAKSESIFTEEDIINQKQKIFKLLQESIERKEIRDDAGEEDDDIKEIAEKEKERENNFQITLTFIIEKLFAKYPDLCAKHLLPDLYTYSQNIMQNQSHSESLVQVAMYLYVDMLECLGPARLGTLAVNITTTIIDQAKSKYPSIRQASCYGIGVLAKTLQEEDFKHIIDPCIQNIKYAYAVKKESKGVSKIEFGSARDNAIAAYGKIIKYKFNCLPLDQAITEWISMLPLKYDEKEGREQNELFAKIVAEKTNVVGQTQHDVQRIIDLIIDALDNDDMINDAIRDLLKNAVNALKSNQHFGWVWGVLTESHRKTIDSLFIK